MSADRDLFDDLPDVALAGKVVAVDTASRTLMFESDAFDGGNDPHGPAPYDPHVVDDGGALELRHPVRGDACCVLQDNEDGLWVARWTHG